MNRIDVQRRGNGQGVAFDPIDTTMWENLAIGGMVPDITAITNLPSVYPVLGLE